MKVVSQLSGVALIIWGIAAIPSNTAQSVVALVIDIIIYCAAVDKSGQA